MLINKMSHNDLAIIFVSNGPGELATWVNPLAKELHKQIKLKPRVHNSKHRKTKSKNCRGSI